MDSKHRGAGPAGPFTVSRDRRVTDLVNDALSHSLTERAGKQFMSDMNRGAALEDLRPIRDNPVQYGVVLYSVPYANWYKVQLGGGQGVIGCCMLSESGLNPVGVRSTSPIPAGSRVYVLLPAGNEYGVILGVAPVIQGDGRTSVPDWLVQGGGSGLHREAAYTFPFSGMYKNGGILDFSAGRPVDSTSMEWGRISETGIGILIDSFMAYLRVNEMCGLFLNYFDSYCRLAGVNLDIQSAVHELSAKEDEGELQLVEGRAVFPWEALGAYAVSQQLTANFSTDDILRNIHKAATDLPEGSEDIQPIHRYQSFGGYLGQGGRRSLIVPGKAEGFRKYSDTDADYGVFDESIGLDGTYLLRSARQVVIGKRVMIPVPKQVRPSEDPTGDDAREDNYKFSGQFGSGSDHKVGRLDTPKSNAAMFLQPAALQDLLAYEYTWRTNHPFHYHANDYDTPDESKLAEGSIARVQDKLDFSELIGKAAMSYPEPVTMKVDHRYGDVEYFQREASVALLEDGSISLSDGYGSQIVMGGGHIRIECPGDLQIATGRNAVTMAGRDAVVKANKSVDVTASNNDIRFKAEANMQMLAGNSGVGGVLIESKATSAASDYDNKIGEEVVSSGVTIKSEHSDFDVLSSNVYLRTGHNGEPLDSGEIVLDASQGRRSIVSYASNVTSYVNSAVAFYVGPSGEQSSVSASHVFGNSSVLLDGDVYHNGIIHSNDAAYIGGNVLARGAISATSGAPFVAAIESDQRGELQSFFSDALSSFTDSRSNARDTHESFVVEGLYGDEQKGNTERISQVQFSLRDDITGTQYGASEFYLIEPRWQMMSRLGLGTGGDIWVEPSVTYQGQQQQPWPGKSKWADTESLKRVPEFTLIDSATSLALDGGEIFEDAALPDFETATINGNYKVIR